MSALADPFEVRRAVSATGLLRRFNEIGLLSAADVHVAARLADLHDLRLHVEVAALDKWLTLQSGCDASNSWCDAASRYSVLEKATGCSAAPGEFSGGLVAAVMGLWQLRRRRR